MSMAPKEGLSLAPLSKCQSTKLLQESRGYSVPAGSRTERGIDNVTVVVTVAPMNWVLALC